MTLITDGSGASWVELSTRKRRGSPRAVRFAEIKVGDQVQRQWTDYTGAIDVWYYLVTDLWFDPVAGQRDEVSGQMVAIARLKPNTGKPESRKERHTLRGLASQGFIYAKIDFVAHTQAVITAKSDGCVIGIAQGRVIRRRPKIPGGMP